MKDSTTEPRLPNYIRAFRRRTELNQRELAEALGFDYQSPVSRHERFEAIPSLRVALAYEIIFRVPVSEIFAGLRDEVEEEIGERLEVLRNTLRQRSVKDRNALATTRKLTWLSGQIDSEPQPQI